jgi:glycosyltransferase involved in cell wall biosynthesis
VPSKLLPHKGLTQAVHVARRLAMRSSRSMVIVTGASSPHESETSAALARELRAQTDGLRDGAFVIAAGVVGGELGGGTVRDLMMMADVVYVPSLEEGFGVTLREAAALRVPVVASDIPAFRESGDGWATYVPGSAPPERVAAVIEEIVERSSREARVRALKSSEAFRRDVIDLLVPSSSEASRRRTRP